MTKFDNSSHLNPACSSFVTCACSLALSLVWSLCGASFCSLVLPLFMSLFVGNARAREFTRAVHKPLRDSLVTVAKSPRCEQAGQQVHLPGEVLIHSPVHGCLGHHDRDWLSLLRSPCCTGWSHDVYGTELRNPRLTVSKPSQEETTRFATPESSGGGPFRRLALCLLSRKRRP